jgi:hypothetical protein
MNVAVWKYRVLDNHIFRSCKIYYSDPVSLLASYRPSLPIIGLKMSSLSPYLRIQHINTVYVKFMVINLNFIHIYKSHEY